VREHGGLSFGARWDDKYREDAGLTLAWVDAMRMIRLL
jgi:hypothetical protein